MPVLQTIFGLFAIINMEMGQDLVIKHLFGDCLNQDIMIGIGAKMLSIRIKSNNAVFEGELHLRQLNQLLESLVDPKLKEIKIGKWTERKSELVSIDVFERGLVPVYKSNQELPDGV